MHEHFSHLLITAIPFLAIVLLILWRNRTFGFLRSGLLIILLLVITLQAVPFHYLHAAHSQDLQTYQCCMAPPMVAGTSFELTIPLAFPMTAYSLPSHSYAFELHFTSQSRAPPLG